MGDYDPCAVRHKHHHRSDDCDGRRLKRHHCEPEHRHHHRHHRSGCGCGCGN